MNTENDDPLLARLRALPANEADRARGERVHRAALAAFGRPFSLGEAWSKVGVPVMLATLAVAYLGGAISAASALYQ
jgi:hypothetical protein